MKKLAIVLAAGQGKRMKSKLYKVLHPVCGKPMVGHVLSAVQQAGCERTIVVVGHGAEAVKSYLGSSAEYVLQEQQLGTGHAVKQAGPLLAGEEGTTVVICGDTPLVTAETLEALVELHTRKGAAATVLTAKMDNPQGYGRVIRGENGTVERIVEQKDCSPEEAAVQEINTGTYCFDNAKLFAALEKVTNNNAQQEYYLTDVIGILVQAGEIVEGYAAQDHRESIGVNDRVALAEAEAVMRERIVRRHMLGGVTVIDPASTYIGADVAIGSDTVIYPGTVLAGRTVIGEDCVIGPASQIEDSVIHDGAKVKHSVLSQAEVGKETTVGPFAYLRPGAKLGANVKVGDFVEIKNATLDDGAKVSHLSYIGDAKVGKNVNIGCGAITVNYDGYNKSITEIEDEAFIGSNVNLIAPVKVGKGAYVVAGSTITHSVPQGDLAIARQRQENKPGYAEKIRGRAKAKKQNKQDS
ncbi:MAG: bifunctional UDP-N-acetylglucosamine diphosphorylase/glucosamine-1-phosphate N-acetyltransferase GlmU [Paenibacillus macerans]|uniref:bifunctional UDP-N-acetylglucosamine diphosphorylase/glucosamine-1-phosphate N-acetyltransferase GlmU n=1 Tax=Paenibacillus TaxID=44249 RepID=UPI00242CC0D7|nr:bifunctional UDP-N-acetylglucosamine diphosphorylase/glucosamine-1-phosphate N-acetyltransferase GlmU [Paenibacillus macerans]MBS5910838.1 bifunctional UDP-N-acetylglucosamine diphosphorylase/glucosamine-1-phosphate N-acetyltransferase GlmU [Paenibacillus macerans]MDU7476914.1 bifunctional UDP-N-acetylglucosamine diphosphorylase/glucosamine-1-phosphate N-acetyltransferase GlmU [Paenibacillus macerans]MEC0138029.1 bifunctional UDP-N-acetylglucosamine diphosphorylase/glucosamine-1-phosphate N-a